MGDYQNTHREWIEPDGLGGFASGTASTIRARRYHALLLAAETPPSDRWVLVNGVEAWVEAAGRRMSLSSHRYEGGVTHPDGARRIVDFQPRPWPRWSFSDDGIRIDFELCVVRNHPLTLLRWTARELAAPARLFVRLLMSGRDPHQLQRASDHFRFGLSVDEGRLAFSSYPGVPRVHARANGTYAHGPEWYRNFFYDEEAARGLDHVEDLASPGVFEFDLNREPASLLMTTDPSTLGRADDRPLAVADRWWSAQRSERQTEGEPLARAAQSYVVKRGGNRTVIAGYPWFGDWGRDTFIALRGIRLLSEGPQIAQSILLEWSSVVSEGMLPNRFPDRGDQPEYNSVDASLWYVLAVRDHLDDSAVSVTDADKTNLLRAVEQILDGYTRGTRYGIRSTDDGLLAAGVRGVQLTWMDAKVGDWVVTPRIGKPVEIQALWLNGLAFAREHFDRFGPVFERGQASFGERFYDPRRGYLNDVVDVDHDEGRTDGQLRPNQVLAIGGLPVSLVGRPMALSILERIEANLWTPMGLRSLGPMEPNYVARYEGGVRERDGAYHQGTVWPWLVGPFVDAWVWSHGGSEAFQREARRRFVEPLLAHLDDAGLGHISEIADAEAPHTPRGAPFQAWSVTELFRLDRTLAR